MGLNFLFNIQYELYFTAWHRKLPPSMCATVFGCCTTHTLLYCQVQGQTSMTVVHIASRVLEKRAAEDRTPEEFQADECEWTEDGLVVPAALCGTETSAALTDARRRRFQWRESVTRGSMGLTTRLWKHISGPLPYMWQQPTMTSLGRNTLLQRGPEQCS